MRVAILRLILSVGMGLLLAFTLRPYWIAALKLIPGFQLPQIAGIELGIGAAGLTFASGAAGWFEFLFLNALLRRRIGDLSVSWTFSLKIWFSALVAAAIAWAASRGIAGVNLKFGYDFAPLAVLSVFAAAYMSITLAWGIEEARRGLKKFLPRSRA
jgi:hypothetical protein